MCKTKVKFDYVTQTSSSHKNQSIKTTFKRKFKNKTKIIRQLPILCQLMIIYVAID